ncbi:hypothetical protein [Streptomyces sp. MST-110588]|uniref:hypothetical protein n=1 Tax=Streptomyces sp. MST-110588 TaxID=2833628 RepID=UPI001F5DCA1E|nr:hypothetical protein [Streptomyces sp. MST-110588]UNO40426.1 hypothetical protein KGS77_13615 [Streptomyces sp. MST-110588]
MSTATFTPGPAHTSAHTPQGTTATGPGTAARDTDENRHVIGNVLRAVKVFAAAAIGVVLLGEYAEEPRTHAA